MSQVGIDPFALGPTLDPLFKRSDHPHTKNAVDTGKQVLTAAAVDDDVPFESLLKNNQLNLEHVQFDFAVQLLDECRRFFVHLKQALIGQTILACNVFDRVAVNQSVAEALSCLLDNRNASAAHFP